MDVKKDKCFFRTSQTGVSIIQNFSHNTIKGFSNLKVDFTLVRKYVVVC